MGAPLTPYIVPRMNDKLNQSSATAVMSSCKLGKVEPMHFYEKLVQCCVQHLREWVHPVGAHGIVFLLLFVFYLNWGS